MYLFISCICLEGLTQVFCFFFLLNDVVLVEELREEC